MTYSRYNLVLLTLIALSLSAVLGISFVREPLDGDLTRVGGFSENDFGWHEPQLFLVDKQLYDWPRSLAELNQLAAVKPYDVVVMGDSFSWRHYNSFVNYLAAATGWQVMLLHHNDFTLDKVVGSDLFRLNPPRYLVFEAVERRFYRRIQHLADVDPNTFAGVETASGEMLMNKTHSSAYLNLNPSRMIERQEARQTDYAHFSQRVAEAIHWLSLEVQFALGTKQPRAQRLPLKASELRLFSNADANNILLYIDDFKFRDQWRRHPERLHTAVEVAASLVARNGYSTFIPLIFPDKLTVYADYLEDTSWTEPGLIPKLAEQIEMPRLDLDFAAKIRSGVKDLYLPNDSHTGFAGSKQAAMSIVAFIQQPEQQQSGLQEVGYEDAPPVISTEAIQ